MFNNAPAAENHHLRSDRSAGVSSEIRLCLPVNQSPASRNHASFHPALLPPSMRANGAHSKHWPPGHKSIPKGYFSFSCSQILKNQAASLTRSQAENCSRLAAIPVPTHASSSPVGASGIQMKQSHSDVTVLPLFQGEVKGKKSCKGE